MEIVTLNFAIDLPGIGEVENLTAKNTHTRTRTQICTLCFTLFLFQFTIFVNTHLISRSTLTGK